MDRRNNKNNVDAPVISPDISPYLSTLNAILSVDSPIVALPQGFSTRSIKIPSHSP
jgi:hypothetical protein